MGENWNISLNLGTPGRVNDSYLPNKSIEIELKVLLEGVYNVEGNDMLTSLNGNNAIPNLQPYSSIPWEYEGTESAESIPNEDIVDWVLIEIRKESTSTPIVKRKAGFVKKSGSVVDVDGLSNLVFENLESGEYSIIIYHRNHLPIISSSKLNIL